MTARSTAALTIALFVVTACGNEPVPSCPAVPSLDRTSPTVPADYARPLGVFSESQLKAGLIVINVDDYVKRRYRLKMDNGMLVYKLQKHGPAEKAGLLERDVITSIGGIEVVDRETFNYGLNKGYIENRQAIAVTVSRSNEVKTFTLQMGELDARVEGYGKQTATPAGSAGTNALVTPGDMVLIPAGPFAMGNCMKPVKPTMVARVKAFVKGKPKPPTLDNIPDELPVHTVMVSAFYMDKHEVTKEKWDDVYTWAITNGYAFDMQGNGTAPDHPVYCVKWYDCVKWCNARSEKEGLTPCCTSPVGSFAPNGYGLYDMAGNVCEWCWDWYDGSSYATCTGRDPRGPASGAYRVLRGGDWLNLAYDSRCACRNHYVPVNSNGNSGFRCARGL